MFKKLRWKFIILTVGALFSVLVVVLGVINIINYVNVVNESDDLLDLLAENDGSFESFYDNDDDGMLNGEDLQDLISMFSSSEGPNGEEAPTDSASAQNSLGGDLPDWMTEETVYESRFFSVTLDTFGEATSVYTGMISAVNSIEALEYAEEAVSSGKERGFMDEYRYLVAGTETGTLVIFLDIQRLMSSFTRFLYASILIALIGILVVAILITFISGRVVKPFAESYEKQRRFITDAGHEIKTPLAIIAADAEVLEMDLEEENEWLNDIKTQTRRLGELTNDLVALSRMEEQPDKKVMVEFPVSDVVGEIATPFQSRAITMEKALILNIQPMLSMLGDEKAIGQLVSILLDNALKYSLKHSDIVLCLEQKGKNIRLSVYNKCYPVTKEEISHMFERFYRLDSSRNSSTGGYGIGLSMAQAIVSGHKGKISAATTDGNDITITAVLPVGI